MAETTATSENPKPAKPTKAELMARILSGKIVQAPTASYTANLDGTVSQKTLDFYAARANNPVIDVTVVEHSFVDPRGKADARQLSLADEHVIESLSQLATTIKDGGKVAIIQLAHCGGAARRKVTNLVPWAPSSIVMREASEGLGDKIPTHGMTKADIAATVQRFADAAVCAVNAGFDGVEIHAAHAYLLNEFFSPLSNKRDDEYGGSIENRVRIHCEVARAVRTAVGPEVVVSMRFGGCDYLEGGNTVEDAVEAAKIIVATGCIDILDVSGGMCYFKRPGHKEPGYFSDMTTAIKQAVDLPVVVTGGVRAMEDVDALLAAGAGDLVGVGRALFKNPSWPAE